jgi:hypothetical protein
VVADRSLARRLVISLGLVFILNVLDPTPRFLGLPRHDDPAPRAWTVRHFGGAPALPFVVPDVTLTDAKRVDQPRFQKGSLVAASVVFPRGPLSVTRARSLATEDATLAAVQRRTPLRC